MSLRQIYSVPDADLALLQLQHSNKQWGSKYLYIIKS